MRKDDADDDTNRAVTAPTGLAVYNVGGVIVHRFSSFQLNMKEK